MDHPYVILPEEQAPNGIEHCEICELSKQRNHVIWGEGNPKAPLMMILDNPGAREDREGNSTRQDIVDELPYHKQRKVFTVVFKKAP